MNIFTCYYSEVNKNLIEKKRVLLSTLFIVLPVKIINLII